MWTVLEGIAALIVVVSAIGLFVGLIIGIARKRWRVLLWSSIIYVISVASLMYVSSMTGSGFFDDVGSDNNPTSEESSDAGAASNATLPTPPPIAAAPAPTSTPIPPIQATPTSTPRPPTATPRPTPTPKNCPNSEQRAYLSKTDSIRRDAGNIFQAFARQHELAAGNPLLFLDEGWVSETTLYLVGMQFYVEAIRQLSPPSSVRHIHRLNLEAVDALEDYIQGYAEAADNLDMDGMANTAKFEEHGRAIIRMHAAVDDLCR